MGKKRDRWPELCHSVQVDDGLPTRPVGPWTVDKLWFWNAYIDITTSAMVGSPHWSEVVYVDLFAGPGVCVNTEDGSRVPGSVLIAANAPRPFDRIFACELSAANAAALEKRLAAAPNAGACEVFTGDCNESVHEIASRIPDHGLTLAFVDPEGLDVRFETLRALTERGRVDLLVLLPDSMDIVRNIKLYLQEPSKLDLFLGPDSRWRERYRKLGSASRDKLRDLFTDLFKVQLRRHLGYRKFSHKTMKWRQMPLYRVVYASKHERGLEFWNKIAKKDRRGQRRLFD
jgi:three-Cys-motif partner protein